MLGMLVLHRLCAKGKREDKPTAPFSVGLASSFFGKLYLNCYFLRILFWQCHTAGFLSSSGLESACWALLCNCAVHLSEGGLVKMGVCIVCVCACVCTLCSPVQLLQAALTQMVLSNTTYQRHCLGKGSSRR